MARRSARMGRRWLDQISRKAGKQITPSESDEKPPLALMPPKPEPKPDEAKDEKENA
jgi:hypothetical protein